MPSGIVPGHDTGWEPHEHLRFARYRKAFGEVAPADAAALVARVLTDPDREMANSAVCEYLDRRASELLVNPDFPSWRLEMIGVVGVDAFSTRRLHEWTLLRAMTLGEPWDAQDLLAASNWLQLRTAEKCSAMPAVDILAEGGRTRRIRTIATSRRAAAQRSTPAAQGG